MLSSVQNNIQNAFASSILNSSVRRNQNFQILDADPLTPGIQLQPRVLTSSEFPIAMTQSIQNYNQGQIVDLDPITPGIQSQPGVLTPISIPTPLILSGNGIYSNSKPILRPPGSTLVGNSSTFRIESDKWWKQCPNWLWALLCLVLTALLVGGMHLLFKPKRKHRHEIDIDD